MPVLSLTDITVSFSGPPVLDNVSLHIDRGERVCVIGRNGSGKSTLLKTVGGVYSPGAGSITFPEVAKRPSFSKRSRKFLTVKSLM